jgi:hypothetical protein
MNSMSRADMVECFEVAKRTKANYVGVLIAMEGFETPEVIINTKHNLDKKFEYYMNTYDENLEHKHAKGIKIIGCAWGDSFSEIGEDLFMNEFL